MFIYVYMFICLYIDMFIYRYIYIFIYILLAFHEKFCLDYFPLLSWQNIF